MAGQQKHSPETIKAALHRVHCGEPLVRVAEAMGIPRETLRTAHQEALKGQRDPYPGDQAIGKMVDQSLALLWDELQHIRNASGKNGSRRLDIKRIGDIGSALKTFDQLKRANPAKTEKPDSPLKALEAA